VRAAVALLLLLLLGGARDPILVPEVSQHEVMLRQGFTGTELLLFGAILNPDGTRAARDYDIAVVLMGPRQSIVVREKSRFAGIWLNAESAEFRSAPSYYALASTKPIGEIVDDKTAAIYELGLKWLQLSPIGTIEPEEQARFSEGLVDLNTRQGLYRQADEGVTLSEQVLYQARIELPSSVPIGTYTAETYAISDGVVVATATSKVEVRKVGFERAVVDFAEDAAIFYGLLTVLISIALGWLAGRLFTLV
jgi:uncharacterized protein (TIGR02186 family)